jgi:hypothetical protein
MTVLNRVLDIFFFVLAGMGTLLGFLALPPAGLLFALPYLFLIITAGFAALGSLVAQVLRVLLLLLLILAFWTW